MTIPSIVFGSEVGEHVAIDVTRREFPESTDYWDGNWLVSPIDVFVGGFSGHVDAGLRAEELRGFRNSLEQLYETLTGEAVLESMEDWVRLTFVGDGIGHIAVSGYVRDEPGISNELHFHLAIDQTFLPGIIASLSGVEAGYPVLGKP